MIIKRLEYVNYRGLKTGTIDFDPHLTVVVGKNGSGKSSVLQAVAIAVSWIVARIKSEKGIGQYIDELSVTNGHQNAMIDAYFEEFGKITIPNKTKSGLPKRYSIDLNELRDYVNGIRKNLEETDFKSSVPVFASYGVKRAVIDIPLRIRNTEEHMLETYKDCLNGSAKFRDFFMWFRNQEDLENEYRLDIDGSENYSSRELGAFRRAMHIFLPEYTNVRVRRKPLRMTVHKDGKELNIAQLSDGEKIYIALIGDLCRRLVLANPSIEDPLEGRGIVMIDEVDLHLHPQWQAEVTERLTKVFPNLQFIITTHSPQVINRVATDRLRILENGEIIRADYGYGMPTSIVLQDIMGIETEQPKEVVDLINSIYRAIADRNVPEAKSLISQLENKVPQHPELSRLHRIVERL
ncbi:MAG: AAA family ATPase [Candidatus Cryptobacteroides sp.]